MQRAVIAATRFGLGARPGELASIDPDPKKWLLDQLAGPSRPPAAIRELPASSDVIVAVSDLRRREKAARADNPDFERSFRRTLRDHYAQQSGARYRTALASAQPFHERLVYFWSNHFAVSADKSILPAIAGLYENEAIRPHVGGKFIDLLLAVEKHPAMILYLDNQRSIGPGSELAKRANRRRENREIGLNENLAREILELHTLGVDGGYTQEDVGALARVITGWSIGGVDEAGRFAEGTPGQFEFRASIHEPGRQTVLGKSYADKGLAQGEAVLNDLATHPATAWHIATKLARHFITDDPPPVVVDRLAAAFLQSGGDLAACYAVLTDSDETWSNAFSKYKSPLDFVLSTLRAFDHSPDDPRYIHDALDMMGQTTWRPGSPAGWPDTAAEWGGADALYKRIEWSNAVARRVGSRVNPVALGEAVLGSGFKPETREAVSRAESLTQGTTLLLASPDFQRR